jgi:hypothetical protein
MSVLVTRVGALSAMSTVYVVVETVGAESGCWTGFMYCAWMAEPAAKTPG